MSTITITDTDVGTPVLGEAEFVDATVSFTAEDTYAAGTVMGQKTTSADTYAGVIVGTGSKTIALTPRSGRSMKVGAYVLTVGNVTAGAGPATMVDPDGISESVTLATSGAHQFPTLGVTMTITAGGTELDDAATVTFTVAAGSKWVPFVGTGTNGSEKPSAVLTYELYKASSGDLAARLMVAGRVKKERLVIDAGGSMSEANLAALRAAGVVAIATEQLGAYDNS
jgi:hypothetical protein